MRILKYFSDCNEYFDGRDAVSASGEMLQSDCSMKQESAGVAA